MRVKLRQGLTLTEVLVGACIFAIGIAGVSATMRQGSRMITEAENKKKACNKAQSLLEKYLTYSYAGILSRAGTTFPDGPCYVSVVSTFMASSGAPRSDIPYCTVRVECGYGTNGQSVGLSGIIPYPYVETLMDVQTPDVEAGVDPDLSVYTVTPLVRSDLQVFYDVALDIIDNGTSVGSTDTVTTSMVIDNDLYPTSDPQVGITTTTPILTQPSINNSFVITKDYIFVGQPNNLKIQWTRTGAGGDIKPRKVNWTIIRTENNNP